MTIDNLINRIDKLEILFAEQEHTVEALNSVVSKQTHEIQQLNHTIQLLKHQLKEFKQQIPEVTIVDEKPPHY